ncbi:MAG: MBL fold metallo-hydrolase [Ignisphaera sp.]
MYAVEGYVLGRFNTNSYIIYDDDTLDAIMVDLGDFSEEVVRFIRDRKLDLLAVVATHGHFDHVYGVERLRAVTGAVFVVHRDDIRVLEMNEQLCREFGVECGYVEPDEVLTSEGIYRFGSIEVRVVHTPGHTPGSIVLYVEPLKTLFTGDTIFRGSVGTADLPGGSEEKLVESICKIYRLFPLDTKVLPGHGPHTTLGNEARYNIFVAEALRLCR